MSTQPPSGQEPRDPRYPQEPPAGYPPPGYPPPPAGYPQPNHPQQDYPRYPGESFLGAPPDDPLVPPDFAGWFERIIGVARRSLAPLLIIQTGLAIVSIIFDLIAGGSTEEFAIVAADPAIVDPSQVSGLLGRMVLGQVVLGLLGLFAGAASIHIAVEDAAGGRSSIGTAFGFAAGRALPLIGWFLLAGLLMALGFMLLILPGIYLAIVFSASLLGVVAIERGGIGRSFALVNRRLLPTTGRVLAFFVITVVYILLIGFVAGMAGSVVGTILFALLSIPIGLVWVGLAVVTYAELRFHERPGTLTPRLAAELRQ